MADSVYDTYVSEDENSLDEEEFAEIYGFELQSHQPTPINFMRRMAVAQQITDEGSVATFTSDAGGSVLSSDSESSMEVEGAEGHTLTNGNTVSGVSSADGSMALVSVQASVSTPTQIHTDARTPRTAESSLTGTSVSTKLTPEELEQLIRNNLDSFRFVMSQQQDKDITMEATTDNEIGGSGNE